MKIKYHCSSDNNNVALLSALEQEGIAPTFCMNFFVFDVYSDCKNCDEILRLAENTKHPLIIQQAIFSKTELDNAEWFFMRATHLFMETQNFDYTFSRSCKIEGSYLEKYEHRVQINPFITKKVPNWKPKYNFCACSDGDFSTIFCSDTAKQKIEESDIKGIEFAPLYKSDLVTVREGIHQLQYTHSLPLEAFDFIGEYRIITCPQCGKKNYAFKIPEGDNVRIKKERIPEGIDAFISEVVFEEGWGERYIVVSKKVYQLLIKEMKERRLRFVPIG